jgi:hypothetical protein
MADAPISTLPQSGAMDGTEELAVVQAGETRKADANVVAGAGITENYIPIKNATMLVDSPLRYDPNEDVLISSKTIQTPAASVKVGRNVTLTDSGSGVGYSLAASDSTFELSGTLYTKAAGSLTGLTVSQYPSGASSVPTQDNDTESLTTEDYTWQAEITGIPEDLLRVYSVTVRGASGPQAPVRLRIYIQDPAVQTQAVPIYDNVSSKEPDWEAGLAGFVLVDGQDTVIDFGQGQRLRANNAFWIRYTVPAGEEFSVAGDTVDIGFGTVFVPYQISEIQAGFELEAQPVDDASDTDYRTLSAQEVNYRIANTFKDYQYVESLGFVATTDEYSTDPVTKFDESLVTEAGLYEVKVSWNVGASVLNRSIDAELFIDDVAIGGLFSQEMKDVVNMVWVEKSIPYVFTAAPHDFRLDFGRTGGGGFSPVELGEARLIIERKG